MRYDIPAATKKKVLVVGGGVGGMQAALTCAKRGHEVILCEKSGRLGGVLRCEEAVTFKKSLDYYLNQQAKAVLDSQAGTYPVPWGGFSQQNELAGYVSRIQSFLTDPTYPAPWAKLDPQNRTVRGSRAGVARLKTKKGF
jgi:monoamine oxidase